MLKFYKKALLVFLFIGWGYFAHGQEDYFITQKGDTIKCVLHARGFSEKKFNYTTPAMASPKIINLDTVFEYSYGKITYGRCILPGDSLSKFLMMREHGKIDLFEYYWSNTNGKAAYRQDYYVGKENGKVEEVKTTKFFGSQSKRKERLYSYIADYPELLDKFKTTDNYSFDAIRAVIKDYNNFYADTKSYFITLKGDTINCKIAERITAATSKDSIAYKTATAIGFKALDLDSVKEYVFKDQKLTRKALPGETSMKFVSLQESGKINFYQYDNPNTIKSWYASKGSGPLVLVKGKGSSKEQRQNLSGLISDYPDLVEQLNGTIDYNEVTIRVTISTYNKKKG